MLSVNLKKGALVKRGNLKKRTSSKRSNIDFGIVFKFLLYGIISSNVGLFLGFLMHLIY
ncbi:MAG: hypothetical protein KHZ90_08585 [Veillonella parvula]|uniref:Uncharacterized protein n=1 Tax=Veillonella parvula TaxID=29466 RepID=A0A942WQY5_VEIPA|nr:hypothetical protein [Veillonella parvula]MBS4893818.1 hypothetical protein [Veillonella parvula]